MLICVYFKEGYCRALTLGNSGVSKKSSLVCSPFLAFPSFLAPCSHPLTPPSTLTSPGCEEHWIQRQTSLPGFSARRVLTSGSRGALAE